MKILLVGGSGHVGTFITPYLREVHDLRVFDLAPPRHDGVEFVQGSVTDTDAIKEAVDGVDTFIWLVMQSPQGGSSTEQDEKVIRENYTVNNMGLHLFLWTGYNEGLRNGVYTSTMSVHYRHRTWYQSEEEVPLDTPSAYGLSKGFGELICRYFARHFDMNLAAFRITGPRTREQWIEYRSAEHEYDPNDPTQALPLHVSDEEDLANAYLRAVEFVQIGHGSFEPFFIAGDEDHVEHNLTKAERVLGWKPTTHLKVEVPKIRGRKVSA